MAHNAAATALYGKVSLVMEGTGRSALSVAGRFVDEHRMPKPLG